MGFKDTNENNNGTNWENLYYEIKDKYDLINSEYDKFKDR